MDGEQQANDGTETMSEKYSSPLNEDSLRSCVPTRVFKCSTPICSVDWSPDGLVLVLGSESGWIQFYSALSGLLIKSINCQRYGSVMAVRFLRSDGSIVLIATNCLKQEPALQEHPYCIRSWSLERNMIQKQFPLSSPLLPDYGLCVHPLKSLFLVCCEDKKIRLHDVNGNAPICIIQSYCLPTLAIFDTEGFVFACILEKQKVHLFTVDETSELKYFNCSDAIEEEDAFICHIVFSPDSNYFAISTNSWQHIGFRALYGQKLCDYRPPLNAYRGAIVHLPPAPTFSADGKFFLSGV
ncbi:hypothetical protein IE077_001872 [Cardiosporidium cionae]|uniref:Uncharacterized protein n=1 Tax=Cardiosporidium cionae TaxID=476202 RepID=A0ABQ7JC19_9APIC|nr:hypothetical protein IE077_001872 [Cardiosporidium cionae]|eukprot:KAF8821557.1 hypothetical protein IE077_001872 [Cardiosporidium cionae]